MRKVIAPKNLPANLPVVTSAVMWLLLDRLQAPGWLHGIVWTIMAMFWAASVYAIWNTEKVDVLK